MSEYRMKTPKKAEEAVVGTYRRIENAVVGTYQKIEDTVVGAYKKVEAGAVGGYKKLETAFVGTFLEHAGGPGGEEGPEGHALPHGDGVFIKQQQNEKIRETNPV